MSDEAMPRLDEIEGQTNDHTGFEVTDLGSASWAAGKIKEAQEAKSRIQAHAAMLRKQIDDWVASTSGQWDDQIAFFEPMIQRWAEEHMHEYSKKKSMDLLSGVRIGFRAGSQTVEIDDEQAAIAELKQYQLTDSIKVKESVSKADVKKHLAAGVQFNSIRMDQKPETFYVKVTGE